nr:MAG TPA: hypothetical protein [Caudoviricetes sp.]
MHWRHSFTLLFMITSLFFVNRLAIIYYRYL